MTRLSVPSGISVVAASPDVMSIFARRKHIGSVSATSEGDLLRLDVGVAIVGRGDLLSPAFRRGLATDIRLCHSPRLADRTELLRLLSDAAVAWDVHRSAITLGSSL